jgi:hypothetical protein
MPCGGIIKVEGTWPDEPIVFCRHCQKVIVKMEDARFVIEWDDFIHEHCTEDYLKTDEGKIIIQHGHMEKQK